MKILLLNGPNLDRLGTRQPEIYGSTTLEQIVERASRLASDHGASLEAFQSAEAEALVDRIRSSGADAIIINPASLTHHSRELAAALRGYPGPVIEVHISNIHRREPYRRRSLISEVADGCIIGMGVAGYDLAVMKVLGEPKEGK